MSLRLTLLLLSLLAAPVAASCPGSQNLGSVAFERNSSYFNQQGKAALDKLLADSQSLTEGYLLLEFSFNRQISDKKLREYNMWLAQRRVDRVRNYISGKSLTHPVITKIHTAGDEGRTVTLSFCESEPVMLADGRAE